MWGKISRYLFKIVLILPQNLIYAFVSVIPKDKSLWLFSAWNGRKFLDNPKYIYQYLLEEEKNINAVWVTKDRKLYKEMCSKNLPAIYAYSMVGILKQMRASVVVFTHSVEWEYVSCLVGGMAGRVQTWHGMPIKKIGYDDGENPKWRAKLYRWIMPFTTDKLDLVIAGGEMDKSKYKTAFNVNEKDIRITGYPRNDAVIRAMVKKCDAEKKKVIYMPTFRGEVGSEFRVLRESLFDFKQANSVFKEIGMDFFIKLHPVQMFSQFDISEIESSSHIHVISNDGDIYEKIGEYDILITDFSGVYFDFIVTGKPIIMAPFNIKDYLAKDRELYYRYEDICPDAPCENWGAVFDRLRALASSNYVHNEKYIELRKSFHEYLDANSSKRVVEEIKSLRALIR